MKLFIDSDILLDVLLGRDPHFQHSAFILNWAESHPGRCAVSWHSLANIHYLSKDGARNFIREILEFCQIPAAGSTQLQQALDMPIQDLEDAMQVSSAALFGAQAICTRNLKDYEKALLPACTPAELHSRLT